MEKLRNLIHNKDVKNVYFYGAASSGRRAIHKTRNLGIDTRKISFVDTNPQKWGKQFEGHNVVSPKEMFACSAGYCFITSYMNTEIALYLETNNYLNFSYDRNLLQFNFKHPKFDLEFCKIHQIVQQSCNMDMDEQYTLYSASKAICNIKGDLAEVGVYKGGSAKLILLANSQKRKLFLFDTFEGLPSSKMEEDDLVLGGWLNDTSSQSVRENLTPFTNFEIIQGIFPDSVAEKKLPDFFALVHLDTDIYDGTYESLKYFWPKMSTHGRIIIHDYNNEDCPGVKQAVTDYFQGSFERVVEVADSQAVIIK